MVYTHTRLHVLILLQVCYVESLSKFDMYVHTVRKNI